MKEQLGQQANTAPSHHPTLNSSAKTQLGSAPSSAHQHHQITSSLSCAVPRAPQCPSPSPSLQQQLHKNAVTLEHEVPPLPPLSTHTAKASQLIMTATASEMKQRRTNKQVDHTTATSDSTSLPKHRSGGAVPSSYQLPLLLLCVAYGGLVAVVTVTVTRVVSTPYMDEPFHVEQTAQYCQHRFDVWDEKITTFPGLYLASLVVQSIVKHIPTLASISCSLSALRLYNVIWSTLSFLLYFLLTDLVLPSVSLSSASSSSSLVHRAVVALRFGLFPIHFFYLPLYYTDTFSTFTVLLLLYSAASQAGLIVRKSSSVLSSPLSQLVLSIVAVLARQTNILWVLFIASFVVIQRSGSGGTSAADDVEQSSSFAAIPRALLHLVQYVLSHVTLTLQLVWPYLITALGFIAFLLWNGGTVVVGDKSHHIFTLHLGQLLHFASFTAAFSCCRLMVDGAIPAFIRACTRSPLHVLMAIITTLGVVLVLHSFTFSHAFLLSDNRHVTFYVWRYLFRIHPLIRYALTPLYVFSLYATHRLIAHQPLLLQLMLWLCIVIALVPSPLLEFRYFIAPFVLITLFSERRRQKGSRVGTIGRERVDGEGDQPNRTKLWADVAQLALYLVVDGLMLIQFLLRPSTWGDGTIARFMW